MTTSSERAERALMLLRASPYDEEGWRVLYTEYWPYVVYVVGRVLGPQDSAVQDVSQDVFFRLLRTGPASDFASSDALQAYLRMSALNAARDALRARKRVDVVALDQVPSAEALQSRLPSPEDALLESEALRSIVAGLSDSDRQIVVLLSQGYSLPDLATALGISYSAVGVRIHRLRHRLAKSLGFNVLKDAG